MCVFFFCLRQTTSTETCAIDHHTAVAFCSPMRPIRPGAATCLPLASMRIIEKILCVIIVSSEVVVLRKSVPLHAFSGSNRNRTGLHSIPECRWTEVCPSAYWEYPLREQVMMTIQQACRRSSRFHRIFSEPTGGSQPFVQPSWPPAIDMCFFSLV